MPAVQLSLSGTAGGPGLLSRTQAASFLGISASYLKALDRTGRGPVRVRLGRRSLYRVADLEDFARRHAATQGAA